MVVHDELKIAILNFFLNSQLSSILHISYLYYLIIY